MLTSKEVAAAATRALDSKKGVGIQLIRVGDVTTLADYFLICTGTSNTHVKTLCDCAEATLEGLGETMLGRDTASVEKDFGLGSAAAKETAKQDTTEA